MANEAEKILEAIRNFAADHPELAADAAAAVEAGAAAAAAPASPFSIYDVLREVVRLVYPGDHIMVSKAHEAIDAHQQQHEQLVGQLPAQPAAEAQPAAAAPVTFAAAAPVPPYQPQEG